MHDTTNPSSSATRLKANILRVMLDNAVDAQFVLDFVRDNFLAVNPAMCELTGYTEEELTNRDFPANSIIHYDDLDTVVRERREVIDRGQATRRFRVIRKTGVVRWVETRSRRADMLGPSVIVGSARDITDQVNLEKQFRARMEADSQRLRESEQKAREVVRSNARLYNMVQLLEAVPRLTGMIAAQPTVDDVFMQVTRGLTSAEDGLGFERAVVWLVNGDQLEAAAANPFRLTMRHRLSEMPEFSDVLQRRIPVADLGGGRLVAPIVAQGEVIGALEATLAPGDPKSEGDDSVRIAYTGVVSSLADFVGVQVANLRLVSRVQQQVSEDPLTGLHNRRHFVTRIEEEFRRACRYSRPMSLLMIDIDHFKDVNDTHGHPLGDQVLRDLGKLLKSSFRDIDTVCRVGGEEFAVVMPETPAASAAIKAEMVRQQVSEIRVPLTSSVNKSARDGDIGITICVGVAGLHATTSDWDQLYQEADRALLEAKKTGRNRVCVAKVPEETSRITARRGGPENRRG